jgi:hypothetical protein
MSEDGKEKSLAQATRVVAAVASGDTETVDELLDEMNVAQLRALATMLAASVDLQRLAPQPVEAGPAGICRIAVDAAARAFGTTPEAVLGDDRHRAVSDARAVAMAAARTSGITLTAIAEHFNKDHTSVIYAGKKAAANPRLADAAARIVETIAQQYTETIPARVPPASAPQRSNVLQLAALRAGAPTQAGSVPAAAMLAAAERDAPFGVAR